MGGWGTSCRLTDMIGLLRDVEGRVWNMLLIFTRAEAAD